MYLIVGFFAHIACFVYGQILTLDGLGKIKGGIGKSLHGNFFYSFEGVPYALPPISDNRFAKTVPVVPWCGTWIANTQYTCLQSNGSEIVGDEDCLYLNVYTPDITAKLPVIVYFHGGAFQYGSGYEQGPAYLMDYKIVYVSLNYRLGPFGFLTTEDNVAPGNNGLWDQITALKFIKKYIKHFGGDSDSITIYGNSVGGASVNFHFLSKYSRNLFHRGFSQSGSFLNCWFLMKEPLRKTKKLAADLGCSTNRSGEMIECLRARHGRQLFVPWSRNTPTSFLPVIDTWAKEPLLPKHPYELMQNNKLADLPWIVSYTNADGIEAKKFLNLQKSVPNLNTNWYKILPNFLDFNLTVVPSLHHTVSSKIRQEYFSTEQLTLDNFQTLVSLLGDRYLYIDLKKFIELQNFMTKSPVYLYYYSYQVYQYPSKGFGALHNDDTAMMVQTHINVTSTQEDRKIQKIMVNLLVSFASSGIPNVGVKWQPLSKNSKQLNCLEIKNSTNIKMGVCNFPKETFWKSLPIMENEKLFQ